MRKRILAISATLGAVLASPVLHAVPMVAEVRGTITSDAFMYDPDGDFILDERDVLVGSDVYVRYEFDTEEAGPDNLVTDATRNLHQPNRNWIKTSVFIDGDPPIRFGIGDSGPVTDADHYNDYLQMWDQHSIGLDRYMVYNGSRDNDPREDFIAWSQITTPDDDFIQSFDLTQTFSWTPKSGYQGVGFLGYDTAYPFDGSGTGYIRTQARYSISSFVVRAVPEPGTLGLLGSCLLGLGLMRRRFWA